MNASSSCRASRRRRAPRRRAASCQRGGSSYTRAGRRPRAIRMVRTDCATSATRRSTLAVPHTRRLKARRTIGLSRIRSCQDPWGRVIAPEGQRSSAAAARCDRLAVPQLFRPSWTVAVDASENLMVGPLSERRRGNARGAELDRANEEPAGTGCVPSAVLVMGGDRPRHLRSSIALPAGRCGPVGPSLLAGGSVLPGGSSPDRARAVG